MNTPEAFKQMINTRGIWHVLDINENTLRYYRKQVNDGKEVAYSTMSTLLTKAGWEDKGWKVPMAYWIKIVDGTLIPPQLIGQKSLTKKLTKKEKDELIIAKRKQHKAYKTK